MAAAIFVFSPFIQNLEASTVTPKGDAVATLKSGAVSVPVYKNVDLTLDGATAATPLFLTGDGIRVKTILFDFNVYTAVNYISTDPSSIDARQDKNKILDAVRNSPVKLLEMTMLTDLSAADIRSAFKEALRDNAVDVAAPAVAGLLKAINFPFPTGQKISIIGFAKADGTEVVQVELPGQPAIVASGANLASDFWKVWFAKPADDNLAKLQDQLINQIVKSED